MLYTKHKQLTDATETTLLTVPSGFHAVIHYVFIANHAGNTKNASMHFAAIDGSERIDIFDSENLSSGARLTLGNGGGPLFVLHEGEVVKIQTEASSDMEFAVTFDLVDLPSGLVGFD